MGLSEFSLTVSGLVDKFHQLCKHWFSLSCQIFPSLSTFWVPFSCISNLLGKGISSVSVQQAYLRVSWKGTSVVAQWLRTHLPMQGTRVRALIWEDPTCRGATKPVHHNYWACTLEPTNHNYWACEPQLLSLRATTSEAHASRARAPQQEKPPQWEACAPQWRVAPARRN